MLKKNFPQQTQELLEAHSRNSSPGFFGSQEMYLLLGIFLAFAAIFFVWAKYIRKPKSRSSRSLEPTVKPERILRDARQRGAKGRRKRWKRRNPTLAETGGLPPAKNDAARD